jgi:hypothetical protein
MKYKTSAAHAESLTYFLTLSYPAGCAEIFYKTEKILDGSWQSHRKIYTFARYSHDRLHFSVDFSLVPISDLRIIVSNYPGTPKSSTLFVDDSVWPCTFL